MVRIKNRVVAATLLFIVIFFLVHVCVRPCLLPVNAFYSYCIYPFLRIHSVAMQSFGAWQDQRKTIGELHDQVKNLQKERDLFFAENNKLKAALYYDHVTVELREFNTRYLLNKGRIAQVLVRHFSPNNQFFLVDAGSRQGIQKDMIALYDNCIVGRVCEVYPWYCKVCLITDVECKIAAVSVPTNAYGIHEGVNNENCTMLRYVSHLDNIGVGDMVLSSGEGLVFPFGFLLGTVESIERGDLLYTVLVKSALDFKSLSYCIVVAKDEIEGMSLK